MWARELEDREIARSGVPRPDARKAVARRVGMAPTTLENLWRGRLKGLRTWAAEKLAAAFVRELENEIARLSSLLVVARVRAAGAAADHIGEAEAALAAARDALGRLGRRGR